MTDYSKLSDFEINCRVAIVLGMKEHFFMNAEGDDCFDEDIPENERGPIWQTCEYRVGGYKPSNGNCFNPCNNPADAWPIIVENKISVMWMTAEKEWCAWSHGDLEEGTWHWENVPDYYFCCESQLRAAMVCFLMAQESNHANS